MAMNESTARLIGELPSYVAIIAGESKMDEGLVFAKLAKFGLTKLQIRMTRTASIDVRIDKLSEELRAAYGDRQKKVKSLLMEIWNEANP